MPQTDKRVHNVSVGVLGHVDSGKTSLVAAISTELSTAALDKHPQSKQRGITLDLGFSSFTTPVPEALAGLQCDELQFTLVDCPGHASLIRTIIGGAQIIDMMLLVIDVTKGIQAQTAECLVVGEIATERLLVVLNKIDLLPVDQRAKLITKAQKLLRQTFAHTKFRNPGMVAVSAKPGGGEELVTSGHLGMDTLVAEIVKLVPDRPRTGAGAFLMSVDHCFAVKGHGTVLTGTVLQGSTKVNDLVELPQQRVQRKIRSMQIFKKPQQTCMEGDRVGICVTQLDPEGIERCWLAAPGSVPSFQYAIAALEKIRFFAGEVKSRQRLHVTVGHVTVMAEIQFFGLPDGEGEPPAAALQGITSRIGALARRGVKKEFDLEREYLCQDQLYGLEGRPIEDDEASPARHYGAQWGLLQFSQPVTAPNDSLVIASRLDDLSTGAACRLALYGSLVRLVDASPTSLRVFKVKRKEGIIDRVLPDGCTAVCRGFFKKETDLSAFVGLKVMTASGLSGTIEGAFGKSGKFRVRFGGKLPALAPANAKVFLTFKRYIYDKDRRHLRQ